MIDTKKLQEGMRQCLFGICRKCPYYGSHCLDKLENDLDELFELLPPALSDDPPPDTSTGSCCPDCHYTSLPGFRFCPHCGKELT